MNPERLVRSAVAAWTVSAETLVLGPPAIAAGAVLGPAHPWVNWIYRGFSQVALLGFGARVNTNGDAHLDEGQRFVFVANHMSHLDALAILSSLERHPTRFVAKEQLGRIPMFGQALRATGNVFVTRSDTQKDLSRLDEAQRDLLRQLSVLFFAEGTRSGPGPLGAFKRGAAVFALRSGLPLVPIGVHGAHEILPPGYEVKGPGTIGVSIGEPIRVDGLDLDARGPLTERLRGAVSEQIERARELASR